MISENYPPCNLWQHYGSDVSLPSSVICLSLLRSLCLALTLRHNSVFKCLLLFKWPLFFSEFMFAHFPTLQHQIWNSYEHRQNPTVTSNELKGKCLTRQVMDTFICKQSNAESRREERYEVHGMFQQLAFQ